MARNYSTDLPDKPGYEFLAENIAQAILESGKKGFGPSILLLRVQPDSGELGDLVKEAGAALDAVRVDYVNLIPDGDDKQLLDYLAVNDSYFAVLLKKSDKTRAEQARDFLVQRLGVGVVTAIATYQDGDNAEKLLGRAEKLLSEQ